MIASTRGLGGEIRGRRHFLAVRVYYEDTDFSGVAYHASYLRFLERGRTEFLRALGIEQGALLARGRADALGFAVRSMTVDFQQPARMDDVVTIETVPGRIGGASLVLEQRILRGSGVLVTAEVRVAVVAHGRPRRLPADIREKLVAAASPV